MPDGNLSTNVMFQALEPASLSDDRFRDSSGKESDPKVRRRSQAKDSVAEELALDVDDEPGHTIDRLA